MKILVIDDNRDILEVMKLILELYGYEPVVSVKSDTAVADIIKCEPALIILDVRLRGQDGRSICKQLSEDDCLKKIPVVLFSSHPNLCNAYKDFGAVDYLPKPFELTNLINTINRHTQPL